MGEINVSSQYLRRLLADSTGPQARPYQTVFAELADSHLGRLGAVRPIIVTVEWSDRCPVYGAGRTRGSVRRGVGTAAAASTGEQWTVRAVA